MDSMIHHRGCPTLESFLLSLALTRNLDDTRLQDGWSFQDRRDGLKQLDVDVVNAVFTSFFVGLVAAIMDLIDQ